MKKITISILLQLLFISLAYSQGTSEKVCGDDLTGQPDATSIVLRWTPYLGTQTAAEYRVKRNGADIGSTIGKLGYFTDHGLAPGTTYSYLVEGLEANGNMICKSNSINVTTASQSTIRTRYNLLAIAFNPQSGIESELNHIRTFLNYRLDFLKYASQNSVNLDIYNSDITIINASPPLKPNSTSVDYIKLASTIYPELGNNTIVDLIESYDIDIVWVVGTPTGYDFGENILMGNSNLGNDTWISEKVKCSRSFFIHSNSPDARAFDAAAHHVEGTMTSATEKSLTNWPRDKEYLVYTKDPTSYATSPERLNLFEQFRLTDEWNGIGAYASKGNANCGSSHFVPGSIRNSVNYPDYTYYDIEAWKRYVDCYADDWLSYPNFSNESRKISGYDFGAFNNYQENTLVSSFGFGTSSFHYWWFNHIPHNPGVTDRKLNNWWPYIYDCNRFDGSAIEYPVDGFPVTPVTYTPTNDEYGTEETGINTDWMFWHTNTDFGQRADLSIINKIENPEYVKNGQHAIKIDLDIESFSINGRNDLIYPSFKNAHWQFSNIDSIVFSVKLNSQDRIRGTNPIIRLCKNGNNRIEFVPRKDDAYVNLFNEDVLKDSSGWYTFSIPIEGNNSWERNVIGYIDSALSVSEQELVKLQIVSEILKDVNYFEISIQSDGSRGESLVYYIDNLKVHHKDTTNAPQSISGFSLINERTGDVILDFYDSITLDIGNPDFSKWTIRANTLPDTVGSVVFRLDKKIKQVENFFPYTLQKNILSLLKPGIHTLATEIYSKPYKRGEQGIGRTATINIINSAAILNFEVVDISGKVLMELNNGDTINIKDPAFELISIVANVTTKNVGSVTFWLNHRKFHTENQAPYSLNGDYGGYFNPWKAKAGNYTLVAVPYSWKWGIGYAGEARKVHFKVIEKEICNENNSKANVANARVSESIEHQGEEISLSLFPVPVEDELHIKIDKQAGNSFFVAIRNIQGQSVHAGTYSSYQLQNTSIRTAGWQSGIYYVQIFGDNGLGKIVKFVKK